MTKAPTNTATNPKARMGWVKREMSFEIVASLSAMNCSPVSTSWSGGRILERFVAISAWETPSAADTAM